jgi:hypothetical protein
MKQKPVVLVVVESSWHGVMRLPKLIAEAGAEMLLMCRADDVLACSRYTGRVIEVGGTSEGFCESLLGHLREHGARYAMCIVPDEGLLYELLAVDDPLVDALIPFTRDPATIECVHSKLGFLRECSSMGVPVAGFRICHTREEVALGLDAGSFPFVLKAVTGSGGSGVRIVHEEAQLDSAVGEVGFPLALQAYVAGQPFSTEVLFDRGVPVYWSSSAQLNRWPNTLGSITAKQLIEVPGIESALVGLGRRTKFHGFACIDAIEPRDGGTIVFCEMNPMQGAEATADKRVLSAFAAALGRMLRGEPLPPRIPPPLDRHPIGLFPETFYYLKSHPGELANWVAAFRSLRHLPYDDPPLLMRLCADLLTSVFPCLGIRTLLTRLFGRKKVAVSGLNV